MNSRDNRPEEMVHRENGGLRRFFVLPWWGYVGLFVTFSAIYWFGFGSMDGQDLEITMSTLERAIISVITGAVAAVIIPAFLNRTHFMEREVSRALGKADALDESASRAQTLAEYVDTTLAAASERQRAAVLKAENRANRLSTLGTVLMVAAVLVPFLMVGIYLRHDPAATAKRLAAAGLPAAEAAKAAQPDWHLLLAGVSFGLLFIASARGIFLAEARQRDVYAREMRETAYYGDLARALGIAQRLDNPVPDGASEIYTRDATTKIMALLLEHRGERAVAPPASAADSSADQAFTSLLSEAAKTLK